MALSEALNKPAAKATIIAVAVLAIGLAAYEVGTSSAFKGADYGRQVSPQETAAGAQKAIEALKTNTTLPESVKQEQIRHLQGEINAANGKAPKTSGPPTTPSQGAS